MEEPRFLYELPAKNLICIDDHLKSLMERDTGNSNAAYDDFPTPMWVDRDVFLKRCTYNGLYSAITHVLSTEKISDPKSLHQSLLKWHTETYFCDEMDELDRVAFLRLISPLESLF